MKIYIEGEKSKAICSTCRDMCSVTFKYRVYATEHGDIIPDVLQGFCDKCGDRLLMPPQSTPKIAPYYQRLSIVQEFRVPHAIEDALLCLSSKYKIEKPDLFKTMLRFYLQDKARIKWISETNTEQLGKSGSRLSFRVDEATDSLLSACSKGISVSKNKFVSMMIWDAKDRLLGKTATSRIFYEETKLLRFPEEVLA
jgi:hypothetical protein